VLVPAEAGAVDEGLLHLVEVLEHGREDLVAADHEGRAVGLAEHQPPLGRERVGFFHRVVVDEAARRLRVQPLARVAHPEARLRTEAIGAHRAGAGHRLVQAEAVAEDHQGRARQRTEFADQSAHQRVEAGVVDLLHRKAP
jgi:hypothetical protein